MARTPTTGRRERKKAATRQALADAALRLFLERGFDQVTVAQIAEAADTAVSTLFAHFPGGKEALILGDGAERAAALTAAVRERPVASSILVALKEFLATRGPFHPDPGPDYRRRTDLVVATPALRAHARTLWTGAEAALTRVLAAETGRAEDDLSLRLLARYVLEIPDLAARADDPRAALDTAFAHLERGWPGI
ncbi:MULTISPECIES: TetR/AcrR family transcriptional regulator [unclassified Crossiella]|uniref:TetR/AcrR family transcriptional regulator n=1 Tax=unclassified Crossiella TaxID=2620835 RepID=UPI001FFEF1FA|nr:MULTISPECIES: TetR/AcrR family transcriptional regulator [unclassified Crossiella]MCK2242092.1 TetR/AcrR family transcriptional regulator [Crossiella sp. S99.2]MCK2255995.1 TetR/AcrR family transcriptional regulator [Crossiella sp. S99.1]